jgi:hypothetical protein
MFSKTNKHTRKKTKQNFKKPCYKWSICSSYWISFLHLLVSTSLSFSSIFWKIYSTFFFSISNSSSKNISALMLSMSKSHFLSSGSSWVSCLLLSASFLALLLISPFLFSLMVHWAPDFWVSEPRKRRAALGCWTWGTRKPSLRCLVWIYQCWTSR